MRCEVENVSVPASLQDEPNDPSPGIYICARLGFCDQENVAETMVHHSEVRL